MVTRTRIWITGTKTSEIVTLWSHAVASTEAFVRCIFIRLSQTMRQRFPPLRANLACPGFISLGRDAIRVGGRGEVIRGVTAAQAFAPAALSQAGWGGRSEVD